MKKTVKVIAVTSLSITLIGCLAFIYILLRTNIILKSDRCRCRNKRQYQA